ncbi:hypothetical protein G4B88_014860, partial [Cannabis sativa]
MGFEKALSVSHKKCLGALGEEKKKGDFPVLSHPSPIKSNVPSLRDQEQRSGSRGKNVQPTQGRSQELFQEPRQTSSRDHLACDRRADGVEPRRDASRDLQRQEEAHTNDKKGCFSWLSYTISSSKKGKARTCEKTKLLMGPNLGSIDEKDNTLSFVTTMLAKD